VVGATVADFEFELTTTITGCLDSRSETTLDNKPGDTLKCAALVDAIVLVEAFAVCLLLHH
jgi:hypothetical protein